MGRPVPPKIVFMGSPRFAAVILDGLVRAGLVPAAVFTQEDKSGDRGHRLIEPEAKIRARELSIPVFQPKKLGTPEVLNELNAISPDLIVVAAYGKLLPREVLAVPRIAPVNVHASLLPRWRGASPVHHAILSGDEVTGISIMRMEEGLDTGPVYLFSDEIRIGAKETSESLSEKLATAGAELIPRALEMVVSGAVPVPQDGSRATSAPKIKKEDGLIRFDEGPQAVERMARAYYPWPKAYFNIRGARVSVLEAEPGPSTDTEKPGVLLSSDKLWFSCGGGSSVVFRKVQREGRKALASEDFLRGFKIEKGEEVQPETGR